MWKRQSCCLTGAVRYMRVARCAGGLVSLYSIALHLTFNHVNCLKSVMPRSGRQKMCMHVLPKAFLAARSLRLRKWQFWSVHTATGPLHGRTCLTVLQLVDLADSALSGKIHHIPDNMYDLDADWEIDPKALTLMEKIGDYPTASTIPSWK